jgi:quercetin dioxygenase-like cupin family protein
LRFYPGRIRSLRACGKRKKSAEAIECGARTILARPEVGCIVERRKAIMSPVRHRISGSALSFSLDDELRVIRDELRRAPERIGRTLVKDGPLRVTLVGIQGNVVMREHRAAGPVTIHVLEGGIEVTAADTRWPLRAGDLLALDAGVLHTVASKTGGIFLLTIMHGASDYPVKAPE